MLQILIKKRNSLKVPPTFEIIYDGQSGEQNSDNWVNKSLDELDNDMDHRKLSSPRKFFSFDSYFFRSSVKHDQQEPSPSVNTISKSIRPMSLATTDSTPSTSTKAITTPSSNHIISQTPSTKTKKIPITLKTRDSLELMEITSSVSHKKEIDTSSNITVEPIQEDTIVRSNFKGNNVDFIISKEDALRKVSNYINVDLEHIRKQSIHYGKMGSTFVNKTSLSSKSSKGCSRRKLTLETPFSQKSVSSKV
jgi:hypothetical protein